MAKNTVINVLRRGQVSTDKLTALLAQHNLPPEVTHLLKNIEGDFFEAVAMLQNAAVSPEFLPSTDENEMCTKSSKKRRTQVAPKSYSRKKADRSCCKMVIKESMDDGFAWRKYGQKEIFNAKHPRNYFRCTHKYDENCQAARQVQRSEQQPQMYEITYVGEHTCKQAKKCWQVQQNSYNINSICNTNNPIQYISSSTKHEHEEEVMNNQTSSGSFSNSSDQVIPCDFLELESIIPSDSFSMEVDGDAPLDLQNFFSDYQFGPLFQELDG